METTFQKKEKPNDLKIGDTIKCSDADDMIDTMERLTKSGINTDFVYEKDGKEGFWLEVIGYY